MRHRHSSGPVNAGHTCASWTRVLQPSCPHVLGPVVYAAPPGAAAAWPHSPARPPTAALLEREFGWPSRALDQSPEGWLSSEMPAAFPRDLPWPWWWLLPLGKQSGSWPALVQECLLPAPCSSRLPSGAGELRAWPQAGAGYLSSCREAGWSFLQPSKAREVGLGLGRPLEARPQP